MIRSLKELIPQHNRRLITRIALWSGVAVCIGLWGNLFYQLTNLETADTVFTTYFAIEDTLSHLWKLTDSNLVSQAEIKAETGALKGWKETAQWLEAMSAFGDTVNLSVTYRLDSLQVISGGNPRIHALPVHFRVTPANRFDSVIDFMKKITADTTVAVRIDNAEFIGSTNGLFDVLITVTGWIKL
jgi:hypothetical protein